MKLIHAIKMERAFTSLFNIYAHELSKYNPWLGTQIDMEGNYVAEDVKEMLTDKSNEAYCIIEDNRPIGFVVFSYSDNPKDNTCYISEIFLLETSRKKGICEKICIDFWKTHNGICKLHILKGNQLAISYWEKLILKAGYRFEKKKHGEQMWSYEFML